SGRFLRNIRLPEPELDVPFRPCSVPSRRTSHSLGRCQMATGIRRHQTLVTVAALAVGWLAAAVPVGAQSSETPRRGGVLLAAIAADAPSLDPHQESTFATLQPVAPLYSTLLQIDPYSYPRS